MSPGNSQSHFLDKMSSDGDERFDSVLLGMAQQCGEGGVPMMIDLIFGFLARKTDFYVGGKQGEAEKMILDKFRAHQEKALKAKEEKEERFKEMNRKQKERLQKEKREQERVRDSEYRKEQKGCVDINGNLSLLQVEPEDDSSKIVEVNDEEAKKFMEEEKKGKENKGSPSSYLVHIISQKQRCLITKLQNVFR